jgi:hypothetical protein
VQLDDVEQENASSGAQPTQRQRRKCDNESLDDESLDDESLDDESRDDESRDDESRDDESRDDESRDDESRDDESRDDDAGIKPQIEQAARPERREPANDDARAQMQRAEITLVEAVGRDRPRRSNRPGRNSMTTTTSKAVRQETPCRVGAGRV